MGLKCMDFAAIVTNPFKSTKVTGADEAAVPNKSEHWVYKQSKILMIQSQNILFQFQVIDQFQK